MFQKILAAMDMTKTGKHVFEEALDLAKVNGASLMLLHVLCPDEEGHPDMSVLYNLNPYQVGTTTSEMTEKYQKQWEAFANKGQDLLRSHSETATAAGVYTECAQNPGSPGRTICEVARTWEADLIVMGRRGLSGLSEAVLGSVSNYVIHHAHCSVLNVQVQASRQPAQSLKVA